MKEAIRELRKDFKEKLNDIDFNEYDPYSLKSMTASFIGQMWFLIKELAEDDEVEEELDGARKYYERYEKTEDETFLQMAKDELRHAGILIKKKYEWADDEMKAHLEEQENERQKLMKKLEEE